MTRKSILIISYKIPYPITHGGAIAQFFFLEEMTKNYNVTFCTIVNNHQQKKNLDLLKIAIPSLLIIYLDLTKRSSYSNKFVNTILQKSISFTKRIHFYLKNKQYVDKPVEQETALDDCFSFTAEPFLSFCNDLVAKNNFTHIQLEFFETIALLPFLPNSVKKIVIHHEIRSKRNSLIALQNNLYKDYASKSMRIIENAFLAIADKIVVFNYNDKNFLKELGEKVVISPFGIPDLLIEKHTNSNTFDKFIFIGGENHFPNKEGLEWFLDNIFIDNIDIVDWPIYIIGEWTAATRKKYEKYGTIVFTGFLPSLLNYYENAILLCPILSGSGLRTKILHSFANKIPVIATPFASEGLFENVPNVNHLIHFETPSDFINKFEKMKANQEYVTTIANNGFDYLNQFFNKTDLLKKRLECYE